MELDFGNQEIGVVDQNIWNWKIVGTWNQGFGLQIRDLLEIFANRIGTGDLDLKFMISIQTVKDKKVRMMVEQMNDDKKWMGVYRN